MPFNKLAQFTTISALKNIDISFNSLGSLSITTNVEHGIFAGNSLSSISDRACKVLDASLNSFSGISSSGRQDENADYSYNPITSTTIPQTTAATASLSCRSCGLKSIANNIQISSLDVSNDSNEEVIARYIEQYRHIVPADVVRAAVTERFTGKVRANTFDKTLWTSISSVKELRASGQAVGYAMESLTAKEKEDLRTFPLQLVDLANNELVSDVCSRFSENIQSLDIRGTKAPMLGCFSTYPRLATLKINKQNKLSLILNENQKDNEQNDHTSKYTMSQVSVLELTDFDNSYCDTIFTPIVMLDSPLRVQRLCFDNIGAWNSRTVAFLGKNRDNDVTGSTFDLYADEISAVHLAVGRGTVTGWRYNVGAEVYDHCFLASGFRRDKKCPRPANCGSGYKEYFSTTTYTYNVPSPTPPGGIPDGSDSTSGAPTLSANTLGGVTLLIVLIASLF